MKTTFALLLLALIRACAAPAPPLISQPAPPPAPVIIPHSNSAPPPLESASPWATPYPTPGIDLNAIVAKLRPRGPTTDVSCAIPCDLGLAINDADAKLPPNGSLSVSGNAALQTQATVSHHLVATGTHACNTKITDQGPILLRDGVLAEGDATWIEPTYHAGAVPAVIIFEAYGNTTGGAHAGEGISNNIIVKGFTFQGAQTVYDGGVRSTVVFGNCLNCYAIGNRFLNTASIGVEFGGNAASGDHADGGGAFDNYFDQVAAANIAIVNGKNLLVMRNTVRRPSHGPGFGGGVSGIDCETNTGGDALLNIGIFNNDIDYTDAYLGNAGAGSGILVQNAAHTVDPGLIGAVTVANNRIVGSALTSPQRPMTSGLFVTGDIPNLLFVNDLVQHSAQSGMHVYGDGHSGMTVRDCQFLGNGGGGLPGFYFKNAAGMIWQHNLNSVPAGTVGSVSTEMQCIGFSCPTQ